LNANLGTLENQSADKEARKLSGYICCTAAQLVQAEICF
jgi:hypothetical protein